jgi:hypothetical protein
MRNSGRLLIWLASQKCGKLLQNTKSIESSEKIALTKILKIKKTKLNYAYMISFLFFLFNYTFYINFEVD